MIIAYKYGTIYREVVNIKSVDLCGLLKGSKSHPMGKLLFDVAAGYTNFLGKVCPLKDLEVRNLTIDSSRLPSIFPSGDYRVNLTFFNAQDPQMYHVVVYSTQTSNIKSSF